MMGLTCRIPVMWSIGEACAALCARAERFGAQQRARFNWVELVARPGDMAADLARSYWRALDRRAVDTDAAANGGVPMLADDGFSPTEARIADAAGQAERARLVRRRG